MALIKELMGVFHPAVFLIAFGLLLSLLAMTLSRRAQRRIRKHDPLEDIKTARERRRRNERP
jgi:uncharacterized membrane protein YidH (DUF202 family)